MKNKYITMTIILVSIVFLISWNPPINAELTENLGTCDYNSYLQIDIHTDHEVNLEHVYSSISSDALTMEKLTYIPETNTTRYLFTSELYFPGYWEKLNNTLFLYQDTNSGQIYTVLINMDNNPIPDDPWMVHFLNLTERYNSLYDCFNETSSNLSRIRGLYRLLLDEYNYTCDNLEVTTEERDRYLFNLTATCTVLKQLEKDYNETKNNFEEARTNLTVYKNFYKQMTSYRESFYFKLAGESKEYTTIYQYDTMLFDMEKQIAGLPILIVLFVLIAIVICVLVCYYKWGKKQASDTELELIEGVTPKVRKYNKLFARLKVLPKGKKIKTREQPIIETENHDNNNNSGNHEDIIKIIDEKLKPIDEKVDHNYRAIMQKLDKALGQKTTTPQG